MPTLKTNGERFYHSFEVIEGGTGVVRGILSETEQQSQPSYVFVQPRHVFRTPHPTALTPGMVLRTPSGVVFIVGDNGPSERGQGTLWDSFRLFQATGRYLWERRVKINDPITRQPRDGLQPQAVGMIWCAFEPLDREVSDREMRFSFEQRRVIAGAAIQAEDIVDNQTVTKVDKQLGVYIGVLT
jgi:hypothetical protein